MRMFIRRVLYWLLHSPPERELRSRLDATEKELIETQREVRVLLGRCRAVDEYVAAHGDASAADLLPEIRRLLHSDGNDIRKRIRTELNYWRERLAEHIERGADPRALSGRRPKPRKLLLPPPGLAEDLVDSWKPTPRARVSFVLATYNRLELLKLTVQNIRRQKLSAPSEIIVVDGGSTDGTRQWLIDQADIISIVQHNRVPEEDNRQRKSWGYFINLGFRAAQGKWVCMISDDALLLPGAVEKGLARVESLEAEGRAIGGGAFYFRDYPKAKRYYVQHTLGGMLMVNHGLFLKEALIEVGYAEEDLYAFYKADSDLTLKLWDAGYEIVDCPASFVEHLLLPDEELRLQNNQGLERDRMVMQHRWSGRYFDETMPELFRQTSRRYSGFRDDSGTADAFAPFLATPPGTP